MTRVQSDTTARVDGVCSTHPAMEEPDMNPNPKLAIIAATIMALIAAATLPAAANPTPVPYFDEPAPLCGSILHMSLPGTFCADRDLTASSVRDGHDCPAGISEHRLAGGRYDFDTNRAEHLTYDETVRPDGGDSIIAGHQFVEDNYGAWSAWCVPTRVVPALTPDPADAVVCADGLVRREAVDIDTGQALIRCELPAVPDTPAPQPVFTG